MRGWMMGAAFAAAAATAGIAIAQPPAAPPAIPPGYLSAVPDPAAILRPSPRDGDARDLEDKRVYEAARKLEGGPRWAMAQADVPYGIADQMGGFSCAVGATLTPQTAPKLAALIGKTSMDVGRLNGAAKALYNRVRPYQRWGGTICTPPSPSLDKSYDYPSGHAQLGWTNALVLAEAAPDRASQILARGRAFAESRAVCGVHTLSAVEAGMLLASAQVAAAHGEPAFKADLEAVRAEIAALRANGPKPEAAACAAQAPLNSSAF
ncbi:phosphatase PAP2 family protein [Phenylobacterium sp.]|uniref:acid phosphatase n=1 Tax=Phenylobacterium sp. TaxID=1871053 RepID=UPI00301C7AD2